MRQSPQSAPWGALSTLRDHCTRQALFVVIYGTGLLAACLLVGLILGKLLGIAIGSTANVGGVGIAMLLLIVVSDWLRRVGRLPEPTERGVLFWSAIYIPVAVAMAASQDVRAALTGGPAAITAGVLVTAASFALVPLLTRMTGDKDEAADFTAKHSEDLE